MMTFIGFSVSMLFMAILTIGGTILHIALSVWAYRDAGKRGNSQEYAIGVLLLLIFFPIFGFVVYLFIRRDYKHEAK